MKAIIEEGCIGCGLCTNLCPEVFQMGEDGVAEVCGEIGSHTAEAEDAASSCPVSVIKIEE